MAIMSFILHLLEKPKNESKESAFRLIVMALRIENEEFYQEFFSNNVMQAIHQTFHIMQPKLVDDVIKLLCALNNSFSAKNNYKCLQDLCKILNAEGYKFPEQYLIFSKNNEPLEWTEGTQCTNCESIFNTFNRKHHCRECGQVFCSKCSSNNIPLPHFFTSKPVRVCDNCHKKITNWKRKPGIFDIARVDVIIKGKEPPKNGNLKKIESVDSFDADMKKAIELSLKDADTQKKNKEFRESSLPPIPTSPPLSTIQTSINQSGLASYPKLESHLESHVYDEIHTPQNPPIISYSSQTTTDHIDQEPENIVNTLNEMTININDKISASKSDPSSVVKNQSLHTLFQASLAVYSVFCSFRESNFKEMEDFTNYLDILNKVEQARLTLNETRKKNSLKMQEQRYESEALMRMQMEQKMHLLQQQQLEFEQYQKSMAEQRIRQLEMINQQKKPQTTVSYDAYQNPSASPLYIPYQTSQPIDGTCSQTPGYQDQRNYSQQPDSLISQPLYVNQPSIIYDRDPLTPSAPSAEPPKDPN
ncbi:hypothetical protein HZS_2326, partial [Henneguya salminicola]